jgi:hypothetical protein
VRIYAVWGIIIPVYPCMRNGRVCRRAWKRHQILESARDFSVAWSKTMEKTVEKCPLCMVRDVDAFDPLVDECNKRMERYYFECRRCKKCACSICILQHFKHKENCPFCRYSGIIQTRTYDYIFRGRRQIGTMYRRILSTWDDTDSDVSDSDTSISDISYETDN